MNELQEVCRTCLIETKESLFKVIIEDDTEIPLIVMLSECIGIEVSEEDEISLNICDNCTEQVINAYMFRKQCLESEKKLRSLVDSNLENKPDESNILSRIKIEDLTMDSFWEILSEVEEVKEENRDFDDRSSSYNSDDPLEEDLSKEIKNNELPHPCPLCGRRFKRNYNMKRHMQVHIPQEKRKYPYDRSSKERRHACLKCNKSFRRRYNLKRHMEIHEPAETRIREKRKTYVFVCDYCGYKFGNYYLV